MILVENVSGYFFLILRLMLKTHLKIFFMLVKVGIMLL